MIERLSKKYDLDKDQEIACWDNGLYVTDFQYYAEELRKSAKTGKFYLHMEGGAASGCAARDSSGADIGGDLVEDFTAKKALSWLREHNGEGNIDEELIVEFEKLNS